MATEFHFKAFNKEGLIIQGIRTAEHEADLQKTLRGEGLGVLSIKQSGSFNWHMLWVKLSAMGTVSTHEKIIFNRNLAAMIEAGLSLSRALSVMERQTTNKKMKKVLAFINDSVKKGSPLSTALTHFPNVFSQLMVSMVQSGEESGNLSQALGVVAEQMEKTYTLQKKIKGAMVYPGVIISAMAIIGVFLLVYVVPTLTNTFTALKVELPASTMFIINLSNFAQNHWAAFIAIIFAIFAGIYFGLKTKAGRKGRDWFLLHMPLIAPLVKEVNAARTTRTLASLLAAGVPFVRSLQIVREVVQNSYYQATIEQAEKNIQLGLPISKVFREAENLYPVFVSEMMIVGEETGDLGKMLLKVAVFYEDEVDQKTKNMSTIIEPFLMVLVGVIVGFFAISMISPMYSLVNVI